MKIVYFGTPQFAARILEFLLAHRVEVAAIVTQPDRPQGRKLQIIPPAVKQTALVLWPEIPLLQPEKASRPECLEQLKGIQADLFVVVAYGQILSRSLLAIPPLGCINVHASLLPRYRGAAPIRRTLMNGDAETGVSIQKMVYELDAGDVIAEAKVPIPPDMLFGELEDLLCERSKPLLLDVIGRYRSGVPAAIPQDPAGVTLAPKISAEETKIDWAKGTFFLHNQIRALSPQPGAWCFVEIHGEKKRLKILRASPAEAAGRPGQLIVFQDRTCLVGTQDGSLQLLDVQPEGKKILPVGEWIRGFRHPPVFQV